MGRPVARRMNLTAVSTASVPFNAMSTRDIPSGRHAEQFLGQRQHVLVRVVVRVLVAVATEASITGSTTSGRAAPNGTDAIALMKSR